jgi:hypothetical protein
MQDNSLIRDFMGIFLRPIVDMKRNMSNKWCHLHKLWDALHYPLRLRPNNMDFVGMLQKYF